MAGVLLFLAGYVVFAALTLAAIFDDTATTPYYSIGGSLFVFGSALLVCATVGPLPQKVSELSFKLTRTRALGTMTYSGNSLRSSLSLSVR